MLANQGRLKDATPMLKRAYAQHEKWADLTMRLPAAGLLPDEGVAKKVVGAMKG